MTTILPYSSKGTGSPIPSSEKTEATIEDKQLSEIMQKIFYKKKDQYDDGYKQTLSSVFQEQNQTIIEVLGTGSFGIAVLSENQNKQQFAFKITKAKDLDALAKQESKNLQLLNTIDPHHTVSHIFFTKIQFSKSQSRTLIIQGYGGKALDIGLMKERKITIENIAHITSQFLMFWEALYKHNLVMRDIKPSNITLQGSPEIPGSIKIIDTAFLGNPGKKEDLCMGARFYRSPSIMMFKVLHPSEAPFALGCSLFEMVTYRHRFPTDKSQEVEILKDQRHLHIISETYKTPSLNWINNVPEQKRDQLFTKSEEGTFALRKDFSKDFYIEHYRGKTTESRLEEKWNNRVLTEKHSKEAILPELAELIDALLDYEKSLEPKKIMELPFFKTFKSILSIHQTPEN